MLQSADKFQGELPNGSSMKVSSCLPGDNLQSGYVCRLVGFAVPVGTVMGSSVPWPHTHRESCNIAVERQHKHWVKSVNYLAAWMECRAVREKQNQHEALAWETEAHADFLLDALHLPARLVVLSGGFVIRGELSGVFSSAFVLLTWQISYLEPSFFLIFQIFKGKHCLSLESFIWGGIWMVSKHLNWPIVLRSGHMLYLIKQLSKLCFRSQTCLSWVREEHAESIWYCSRSCWWWFLSRELW